MRQTPAKSRYRTNGFAKISLLRVRRLLGVTLTATQACQSGGTSQSNLHEANHSSEEPPTPSVRHTRRGGLLDCAHPIAGMTHGDRRHTKDQRIRSWRYVSLESLGLERSECRDDEYARRQQS